jgi:hypothetical protein
MEGQTNLQCEGEKTSWNFSSSTQTPPLSIKLQLSTLKSEREIGAQNWTILEKMIEEKDLRVEERNISLIAAINNQRKANLSIDAVVNKIVKYRGPPRSVRSVTAANDVEPVSPEENTAPAAPTVTSAPPDMNIIQETGDDMN